MSTVAVNISDLRGIDEESIGELKEFLEGRTDAKIEVTRSEITLKYEEERKKPFKAHLRVLLRKFLHRAQLKEDLRVISGGKNVLTIKKKKE